MPELGFEIAGVAPLRHAVAPALTVELAITGAAAQPIHAILLACQVLIEPAARAYGDDDRSRLAELFGGGAPPRALVWTHLSVAVPGFTGGTRVSLVLPCPLDATDAAARYCDGVRDGGLPIVIQLGGTVFHAGDGGRLQVAPIARSHEVRHRIPVEVWRATIDHYFPGAMPITLSRETLDRLHAHRRARGLASCDQAIAQLLDGEARP